MIFNIPQAIVFSLKRALKHVIVGTFLCLVAAGAQAAYPEKPIRIIVPGTTGAGPDTSTRMIAPLLTEYLGQQIVVDNRAGASGNMGAELASRAAPDGYTLLTVLATLTSNLAVMKHVPYDLERSFAPISLTVMVPNVLVGHPSLPAKNTKELIAFVKARPGQIDFASPGVGSIAHLAMELLMSMSGTKMLHVPYKGGAQATVDVMAGHVSLQILNTLNSLPHIRTGKLRGLGITGANRVGAAPEIPTIAEAGLPGYSAVQWYGFVAPVNTPRDIVIKLHGSVVRAVQDPVLRKRFIADGAEPMPSSSPEDFGKFMRSEIVKWARVVRTAGINPE